MDFLPLTELDKLGGLPGIELNDAVEMLSVYFLATLRIGAFIIAAPLFGSRSIPLQVRIVTAAIIGSAVLGLVDVPSPNDFDELLLVGVIVTEIAVGIMSGLILTIWFAAVVMAGEKIATAAGLGYAAMMDPESGGQTPVVSRALSMFLLMAFLGMNGHLIVLRVMLESYQYLPIGHLPEFGAFIKGGIAAAGAMFFAAALIMLPIIVVMLLMNLAAGVITRSAPTLNLFSFVFPMNLLAVFILLYLCVDVFAYAFGELSFSALENLQLVMGAAQYG